jgi:hypothetical protein
MIMGLKDFIDQEVPKPTDATQLGGMEKVWLELGEFSWREFEITLSRASMGRRLHT